MADDSGVENEAEATQRTSTPLQWKCLDFGWIIFTWPGRFKAVEFWTTFLGFVLIASANVFDEESSFEFFVFVGVFSWVMVCIHMILGIPHLIEKLPLVVRQPFVFFVCCCIAVVTWLVAASVVVAQDRNSGTVQAGAAFGYITMFVFLFEAIYYFVVWRRGGTIRHGQSEDHEKEMDNKASSNDYAPEDPGY